MLTFFKMVIEQKDKLSDVEYQLKKAEAAERRRIQAAKAARESEVSICYIIFEICFHSFIGFLPTRIYLWIMIKFVIF